MCAESQRLTELSRVQTAYLLWPWVRTGCWKHPEDREAIQAPRQHHTHSPATWQVQAQTVSSCRLQEPTDWPASRSVFPHSNSSPTGIPECSSQWINLITSSSLKAFHGSPVLGLRKAASRLNLNLSIPGPPRRSKVSTAPTHSLHFSCSWFFPV